MNYRIYGPFEVLRNKKLVSCSKYDKEKFWTDVEESVPGLAGGCGCYVFTIRGVAHYVGLAEGQSFRGECFTSHKITQYNEALQAAKGKPQLIFLAKTTSKGRFRKPQRYQIDVRFLEKLLIASAIKRNPGLRNIQGTKLLREMHVPGVLNTGPGEASASAVKVLKKALGL